MSIHSPRSSMRSSMVRHAEPLDPKRGSQSSTVRSPAEAPNAGTGTVGRTAGPTDRSAAITAVKHGRSTLTALWPQRLLHTTLQSLFS